MNLVGLLRQSPNGLVLLAVFGIVLIYLELNRPGLILPGTIGLTALLLSFAGLVSLPWHWSGVILLGAALTLQLAKLRRHLPPMTGIVAGLCALLGFHNLLGGAENQPVVANSVALLGGLLLGPVTSLLTEIARRARLNKGLDS